MIKINMIGGGFQHDVCSSALNKNKYVEWTKDGSSNVSIHIDYAINQSVNPNNLNFGWIAESSCIVPNIIENVKNNISNYKEKFKYIFTHDKRIISLDNTFFKFAPPNALSYIQNKKIYEKTKKVSFIVSNKSMSNGHRFRLEVLKKYLDKNIDHYGIGFSTELPLVINVDGNQESGKLLALKDYNFSFCFENDNYPSIFCEKLTDCFATGTIPIFWGTPDIGDFFDINGMIIYDDNFDFDCLTEDFYLSKKDSIINNFQICNDLLSSEDYIYINYIK